MFPSREIVFMQSEAIILQNSYRQNRLTLKHTQSCSFRVQKLLAITGMSAAASLKTFWAFQYRDDYALNKLLCRSRKRCRKKRKNNSSGWIFTT